MELAKRIWTSTTRSGRFLVRELTTLAMPSTILCNRSTNMAMQRFGWYYCTQVPLGSDVQVHLCFLRGGESSRNADRLNSHIEHSTTDAVLEFCHAVLGIGRLDEPSWGTVNGSCAFHWAPIRKDYQCLSKVWTLFLKKCLQIHCF